MKIVIIGGVGAGASMAARLRRLSKDDKIIILEKHLKIVLENMKMDIV